MDILSPNSREDRDRRCPSISRRSFLLGGCAGALGLFLAPLWHEGDSYAYAVEATNQEFKVFVVSSKEIGIAVVDVTGNTSKPLAGAKVTMTNRSKQPVTLSGTTDEDGNIIFNIEAIGTKITLSNDEVLYRFDGSITIEKSAYRTCTIKRIRCEGGSGMKVPTRLLIDRDFVYFKSMSFDEWDIQYSKCSFCLYPSVLSTHTLAGEIEAPGKGRASVSFVARDNTTGVEKTKQSFDVSFSNDIGTFSVEKRFLYEGADDCLDKNATYYFDVKFSDTERYRFETGLSVVDAALDGPKSGGAEVAPSTQDSSSMPLVSLPSSLPSPFNSFSFSMWRPSFPLLFYATPNGVFMLGIGSNMDWVNSSPLASPSDWDKEGSESVSQQFDALLKRWGESFEKYRNMRDAGPGSASRSHEFFTKATASLAVQAYVLMSYDFKSMKSWEGSFNAIVQLALGASFSFSTTVGPVPIFLAFEPTLSASLALSVGVTCASSSLTDLKIDTAKGNFNFTLNLDVPVTLGVGISGLLSAGLRGTGYFTYYLGVYPIDEDNEDYPQPRHILSTGFKIELVLQALVFKFSGKLYDASFPRLYDSWADHSPQLTAGVNESSGSDESLGFSVGSAADGSPLYTHQGVMGNAGLGLSSFVRDAVIVTEDELGKSAEVLAVQRVGVSAPSVTFEEPRQIEDSPLFVSEMRQYGPANSVEMYDYQYIGTDLDAFCGSDASVSGVSASGGVIPDVDVCIATNVFSNPLEKVVLFHSTPIMFRIISVTYRVNGKSYARTRLAGQRFENGKWGTPQTIDLPTLVSGIDRIDTFDYDFDVITQSEGLSNPNVPNGIHILLLSGTRPSGDQSSFSEVATSPVMSWIILDEYLQLEATYSWTDSAGAAKEPHALTVPRIVTLPCKDGSGTAAHSIAATFLRNSAASTSSIFGDGSRTTADFVLLSGTKLFHGGTIAVNPNAYDLVLSSNTGELDGDGKKANLSFTVVSRSKTAGTRVTTVNVQASRDLSSKDPASITKDDLSTSSVENIGDTDDIVNMQVWPNHSAFLTITQDGVLSASTFDPKVEHGALSTRQVGPSTCKMSSFKISQNGEVLFFIENSDGVGAQSFDDPDHPTPVSVSLHRTYACLLSNDLFSEPFVLAEVSHPQDSLMAVNGGTSYTFLSSCIMDAENSRSDLYYIKVPVNVVATPLGFAAVYQFVEQGEQNAPFVLDLRNDGNVILRGCTIELHDADTHELVDSRDFSFSRENLQASVWNPELYDEPDPELLELRQQVYPPECLEAAAAVRAGDGAHLFTDPVSNNVLLPGKTAQYMVRFNIPETWHGTKKVYLTLKDYQYDTVVTGVTASDAPVFEYVVPPSEGLFGEVPIHDEGGDEEANLYDPGVWKFESDGSLTPVSGSSSSGADGGDGDGSGSGTVGQGSTGAGGNKKNPSSSAPFTGDSTTLSIAGLAATAAAAGLAAYSARRVALERGREDGASGKDVPPTDDE